MRKLAAQSTKCKPDKSKLQGNFGYAYREEIKGNGVYKKERYSTERKLAELGYANRDGVIDVAYFRNKNEDSPLTYIPIYVCIQ